MLDDIPEVIGGGTAGRVLKIGALLGLGIVLGHGLRPIAKSAIKGYLGVADRVRGLTAEADEAFQDLYAEAKHEHEASGAGQSIADGESASPSCS